MVFGKKTLTDIFELELGSFVICERPQAVGV